MRRENLCTMPIGGVSKALSAWMAMLGLLLLAVFLLALAPLAQATTLYEQRGSFGEKYAFGAIGAVDDATGNLLRVDPQATYVEVFAPDGDSATLLTQFDLPPGTSAIGIAIDQSSRAVYVSNAYGGVYRYTSDGLPVPTYTRDLTYAGPPMGGATGEINSFGRIAIDPTNGDLLVVDTTVNTVNRYSAAGAFLGAFNGSDSPTGPFHSIQDLEADGSGDVYVIDVTYGQVEYGGDSVIDRYAPDGTWQENLDTYRPGSVALDPTSGNVVVGNYPDQTYPVPSFATVDVFNDGARIQSFAFPAELAGHGPTGLAIDGGAARRLYVLTFGGGPAYVQVYDSVDHPDIAVDQPTAITDTTAHVSATIDPLGLDLTYRFEHSDDGGQTWTTVSEQTLSAAGGSATVSADLTDLRPNFTHRVRVVVVTANGTFATPPVTFQTATAPPGVVTGKALDRVPTSATLRGTVDPYGFETRYRFEYGTTTAYGTLAPTAYEPVAGTGQGARPVSQVIEGLQPGTTYHYRLVAKSSQGTRHGADRTFTTPQVGVASAYEQISPIEKGGSNVSSQNVQSSPSGDAVGFEWVTAPGGSNASESAPVFPRSAALRDATTWRAFALDPPQQSRSSSDPTPMMSTVMAVSRDGSKALVTTRRKLAEGAVEGDSNFYIRDVATGEHTTVVTSPDPTITPRAQSLNSNVYVGGTLDWSHLLIEWPYGVLVPGDPSGALYEWTDGQLRLASVDPAGDPIGYVPFAGIAQVTERDGHYISRDGRRVFFSGLDSSFMSTPLYMREDGATVPLSVSERTDDAGTPYPAYFAGATADGRFAYFYSEQPLTDGAPSGWTLYERDVEAGDTTLIGAGTPFGRWKQVAAQGRTVYFTSDAQLTSEDGDGGATSIYVWRAGALKHVATPTRPEGGEYLASPSGRYLALSMYSQLTDYDNGSTACKEGINYDNKGIACRVVYRYDAESDELLCASCRPDGEPPTGNAYMGKPTAQADWGGFYYSRSVLDDGTVFFDTPDPLAARDANSARDVYSFDGEQTTLISAGTGSGHSEFGDASADGGSVFFTTPDRLVGQDTDEFVDLYVARLNGGLEQGSPPSGPVPCQSGCQRDAAPQERREVPSSTLRSQGNVGADNRATARFANLSASVRSRLARTGRARIAVRVNRAGRVSVRARARLSRGSATVARGSTTAKRPGLATVTLKLSRPARRALASRGKLTLRLSLTLGGRSTANARLDLRRPAQARRATAPTTTSGR